MRIYIDRKGDRFSIAFKPLLANIMKLKILPVLPTVDRLIIRAAIETINLTNISSRIEDKRIKNKILFGVLKKKNLMLF